MYGIRVNRNGMASCIFHDDRHPSMKVDRRFHCFGCQVDGDVIDLAARLYGLNNLGAAMKLAADFGISYDKKGRASSRPVKKKLSEELRSGQAEIQYYQILSDYNRLLEKWKTEYAPSEPGEEWHPFLWKPCRNRHIRNICWTSCWLAQWRKKPP